MVKFTPNSWKIFGRVPRRPWAPRPLTLRVPAEKPQGGLWEGPERPSKKKLQARIASVGVPRPAGLSPRSPQLSVGLGALSPAGGLKAPELPRLLDGPAGLTEFGLGFRVSGLGFRA